MKRENLNKSLLLVIRNLPTSQSSEPDSFNGEFYQTFKEDLIPLSNFQRIKGEGTFPNSFHIASITLIPTPDKDVTRKGNYRRISLMNTNMQKISTKY